MSKYEYENTGFNYDKSVKNNEKDSEQVSYPLNIVPIKKSKKWKSTPMLTTLLGPKAIDN